jgi:hypothetical protein
MLKFFRRIRKNLLSQGKVKKYLIYSIGEILLVMIGILLALQVNNWNNNQQVKKSEQLVLKELIEEVESNYSQFQSIQEVHQDLFDAIDLILFYIKETNSNFILEDSLKLAVGRIVGPNPTFNPSNGAINSLINSGKIEVIQNDSLKSSLIQWNDLVFDYQEEEIELDELMDNHLRPLLISYIDLNYKEEKLKGSINSSIRKSKEVKNLLALVSQYRWAITMESSNKDFEQFKILRSLNNMRRIINQELDDN